jgi:hypothetical protein
MADADIGGAGAVYVGIETTYGTPNDPAAAGVGKWVPILSETLQYTEPNRYYSEQIRQEAIHFDAKQSYYHVEGDIVMEVDAAYLPYFLYASRTTVTKTGSGPYTYVAVPSKKGSTYPGGTAKGISIGIIRNAVGFLYVGCVVNQFAYTIEEGIARVTLSILGLKEQSFAAGSATPTWIAPAMFGADAHAVYVDTAGLTPAFASFDSTFNGFTLTINNNGEPQNRITRDRSATYIKYGITELSYDTELDFTTRAEYDNFVQLNKRAIRFESIIPGGPAGTFAAATSGVRHTLYNSVYNTYEVGLSGMGDLVMARVNGRGIGITGGSGYKTEVLSPTNIP